MRRFIWPSVALALVILYPLVFTTPFQQRLGALILLYAIAASAWNIIGGYAGQVSVGHVVFFGCGAYASMAAYSHFALPPLVGVPAGIVASVAIAAVIGVPTLRLSGHYFSMATIAVAELARLIVTNTDYLGAAVGLSGPTVPRTVFDLSFISALPYYYLFLTVLLITLGITWWMTNSRMGFYLRAIKDSERAARSLGAPASRTKLYAFMLSAGLTSVAGALYSMMFGFVDPESGLGILISVKMLIMAALGGAGLLFGPLVGAAILVPLEEISNNLLGGKGAGLTFVVYGAIIVLIARFQPGGILALINRLWAKRKPAEDADHAGSHRMLLEARDVTKAFGSFKAVDAASVTLEQGDILGLIGPNGAGKSTFFNCLTGDLVSTSGKVLFEGHDITTMTPEARAQLGLARTFQVPQTFEGMTVLENVMIGAFLRTSHRAEAETKARAVLERVGMSRLADAPARSLGTPGRKRLEIARALATEPKVLLLDEAMAGLTQSEVQLAIDLVRDIHRSGITLVIVEHIMEVIMSLASRVVVFHQGKEIARGSPREVTANPAVIAAYLGTRAAKAAAGHTPVELMGGPADMTGPLLSIAASRSPLRRPDRRIRRFARRARGQRGGAARLQWRRQDHGAQRHCRADPGACRIDPLRRRGDRRPAGVFDRAQGAGAVAGRLAAVRAAERREQSAARRHAAARQEPRCPRCWNASTRSFRN